MKQIRSITAIFLSLCLASEMWACSAPEPTATTPAGTTAGADEATTAAVSTTEAPAETAAAETVSYTPGCYEATSFGMMGELTVAVTVNENTIESVEVLNHNETKMIGWGMETTPIEVIPQQIVASQSLNLDTVTGATMTSNGIKRAVEDALSQAGADTDMLANADKPAPEAVEEELSCDIVIAGAGGAGLLAALEAAANGADVIVVEKAGSLGGNSTRNGGLLMASGTPYAELKNEELFDFLYRQIGEEKVDKTRIRAFVDNSSDMLEYVMSLGTVIECVENIWDGAVDLPAVYMAAAENPDGKIDLKGYTTSSGSFYMAPLYEKAKELGVRFYFETPMTALSTDETGAVTGLVCERKDGASVKIEAQATILATGGYTGNTEMVLQNTTINEGEYSNYSAVTNTGDGMQAAEAIGAAIRREADIPFLATLSNNYTQQLFRSILVTPAGERFTKEYDYHNAVSADLNRAGYSVAYEIIDESFEGSGYPEAIEAAGNGLVVEAATVEELAEALSMDPQTLRATLEHYNELAKQGTDSDYGKDGQYMKEIALDGSQTLYAIKNMVSVTDSFGGIQTDDTMHVLDTEGNRIAGLYAAGAVAFTDWIYYEYPGCGYGFGIALYMGQTAGLNALADIGAESITDIVTAR